MEESGRAALTPVDVVLADDHAMVRAGLRLLLDGADGLRVVAEARDVETALAAVRAHRPRVLILDLNMPGGATIPAIPRVLSESPGTAVVVLTMEEDPAHASCSSASASSTSFARSRSSSTSPAGSTRRTGAASSTVTSSRPTCSSAGRASASTRT